MALKFHGLHAFMPSSIWKKRRCRKKKHQRSWGCPKALTDSPIWGHPKFTDTITLENIYDWNRDHLTKRLQNLETFRSLGETSQVIFETSSPLLAQHFFFSSLVGFFGSEVGSHGGEHLHELPIPKSILEELLRHSEGSSGFHGFWVSGLLCFWFDVKFSFWSWVPTSWHLGMIKGQFMIWDFYPRTWEAEKLESAPQNR